MKIGIIGGGQLALMLIQSHKEHEYLVLEPKRNSSVSKVAKSLNFNYDDLEGLKALYDNTDVITYEFENILVKTLNQFKDKIFPNIKLLEISQNRLLEKRYAKSLNIKTVNFHEITNMKDLENIVLNSDNNWILKTITGGYDGKDQFIIKNKIITNDIIDLVNNKKCILEEFVKFKYETSLIMTRDKNNNFVYLMPTKNIHKNSILWVTHNLDEIDFIDTMVEYVKNLMQELNIIGTLAVEFFITKNEVIFNEMAPRPHNSGHWSIEGTTASQFYNHINAITNQELKEPVNIGYTAVINLIGKNFLIAKRKMKFNKNIIFHDYYKDEVKDGRKMGHITINYRYKHDVQNQLNEIIKILKD